MDNKESSEVNYFKNKNGSVINYLKEVMKTKGVTAGRLAADLKVSQQQISKYIHGINLLDIEKLALVSKILNCLPSEIYPQLNVNPNALSIVAKDAKQQLKNKLHVVNNTYITNNNGVIVHMVKILKGITTVDFLTLNKKVVMVLLALVAIAIISGRLMYIYSIDSSAALVDKAFLVINLLDFYVMVMGLLVGLALPLMVQSLLSYVPLWVGFEASIYFAANYVQFGVHPVAESTQERVIVAIVAFVLTVGYGFLIKKLKSTYLAEK